LLLHFSQHVSLKLSTSAQTLERKTTNSTYVYKKLGKGGSKG
jgi:hypothetical protein